LLLVPSIMNLWWPSHPLVTRGFLGWCWPSPPALLHPRTEIIFAGCLNLVWLLVLNGVQLVPPFGMECMTCSRGSFTRRGDTDVWATKCLPSANKASCHPFVFSKTHFY
jgi:hypothetical protein